MVSDAIPKITKTHPNSLANLKPFRKGNDPRRHVPSGATFRKGRLAKAVDQRMQELLDIAQENVRAALLQGDLKMSAWFMDHYAKYRQTRLTAPLKAALDTLKWRGDTEGVKAISKEALLLAIDGSMSFEELKAVQDALARHAVITGMVDIESLRNDLEELRDDDVPEHLSLEHAPDWGRIRENALRSSEGMGEYGQKPQPKDYQKYGKQERAVNGEQRRRRKATTNGKAGTNGG